MGDKLGNKFDFDFEPFDTGVYVLRVKETDIAKVERTEEQEAAAKGIKNDFNFVIHFKAEGGDMDDRSHFERFPHHAQGHIGLQKLQAAMIKMGSECLKPSTDPAGHDISLFDSEDFKKRFRMSLNGKKLVAIIKRAVSKKTGTEFSNIVAFYNINELPQAKADFARKFQKGPQAHPAASGSGGGAGGPLPGTEASVPGQPPSDW